MVLRKKKTDSLYSVLNSAATTLALALKGPSGDGSSTAVVHVRVRMKNMQQLRYAKQLHEDKILPDEEYSVQKQKIISSLKEL